MIHERQNIAPHTHICIRGRRQGENASEEGGREEEREREERKKETTEITINSDRSTDVNFAVSRVDNLKT
jgi:hypothetical protein